MFLIEPPQASAVARQTDPGGARTGHAAWESQTSLRRGASEMDGDMIARNLSPRLKRLEAELTPKGARVLTILVTRVGADSVRGTREPGLRARSDPWNKKVSFEG